MSELVGTTVGAYRITELLYEGAWLVFRGQAHTGGRAIVTVTWPPTPGAVTAALALPFDGIPALRATEPVDVYGKLGLALIEDEPQGVAVADLKWPLPIAEVISVGLDLARLLQRLHAAGQFHGALRPQTTWIRTDPDGRCSLAGTTPRPELAGVHCLAAARSLGTVTPFYEDVFCDDTLAAARPRGVASDVGQLGMMLYRMATRTSPFHRPDESVMEQLGHALRGDAPPWPAGDDRARAVEELARAAFAPNPERSLAPLLEGLERYAR